MKKVKKLVRKTVNKPEKVGILSIDQSLNGSAIIYTEGGELERLWFCTDVKKNITEDSMYIDKNWNPCERLERIENWLVSILEKYDPDKLVCGLEGYGYGATGKVFELGELGGLVKQSFWKMGFKFIAIPPDSIKLFATGSGNATKSMMMTSAYREHGVDFSKYGKNGEDLSDAFWLNKLIYTILEVKKDSKKLKDLPEHQKRAISEGKKGKKPKPSLLERDFVDRGVINEVQKDKKVQRGKKRKEA